MKLFGYNLNLSKQAPIPAKREAGLASLTGDWGGSGRSLGNAYEQVVWVYRAVGLLAEQVANIPFRFSMQRRKGESLITSGPLVEFYDHPHPLLDRFQYWELRVMWLMLRGECFRVPLYVGSGANRRLDRVLMLDPSLFQHIVENGKLVGWRFFGDRQSCPMESRVLLPEEVWYEKLANPFDFWRGLSPLAVAANAVGTDYAASLHMRSIMENNGEMGLVVRTPEQLDQEQREQMVAALRERKRRAGTADRPVLLWGGAEIMQPRLSSSDSVFLENRRFCVTEICSAFGVPEEIVSGTTQAKYDVMQGARLNFIENRVMPMCRRLEAAEDITVRSLVPDARGWFDSDDHPVVTEARLKRLGAAGKAFEMGVPFNEVNRVYDLGFGTLPWGDRGYLSRSLVPVEAAKNSHQN